MGNKKNITKRPWGEFWDIDGTDEWHLKIISVNYKSRLSLQSHKKRKEFWVVIEGDIKTEVDGNVLNHHQGDIIIINVGQKHRLFSDNGGKIVEISLGKFEEDDIVRYQDDYGRS
jgi:mannose-6-phosphate isomerase-like protein (cupin superfamily)